MMSAKMTENYFLKKKTQIAILGIKAGYHTDPATILKIVREYGKQFYTHTF